MTAFCLIRHGAQDFRPDAIPGRMPEVHLSAEGREQARRMAERAAALPVAAIYSSPLERTRETAEILGERLNLPVEIRDRLTEVNFGEWSGMDLETLRSIEGFKTWNGFRSGMKIPQGERMSEVQARFVAEMLDLRAQHGDQCIALVSHGDPIKTALAYFLGIPLDFIPRLEIGLASVTLVEVDDSGSRVCWVNDIGEPYDCGSGL